MAVNLSPVGGVAGQFFDNNGNPLIGGKLYTYAAGTTTPQTTYTSANGLVAHSNPIVLNAGGRVPSGEIWLTDGLVYKFALYDANDVLIATYDNITGINSNFVNFTNKQEIQTATAGQTVFTLTTMQYQPGTNSLTVFVDGVNQYGPGASYSYVETDSSTVTFNTGLHVGAEVKFTTSQLNSTAGNDAFLVSYVPPFTGSQGTNVGAKLSETVSVKDFGAVGDGVADDTAAIQAAIDAVSSAGGGTVYCENGKTYRITSGITITTAGVVFNLNRTTLVADFASGYAVTIGNGTTITDNIGITNGHITTTRTEVTLSGVLYNKNVRRSVAYTDLRVTNFKGTGIRFQELNWSTQGAFNPLIENCGVNLHLDDNANALTVVGAHLKNADTYNLILRGAFSVSFVGGGNENAGVAGVFIDNASVGSLQAAFTVNFYSVYFEDNGVSHIIANNGVGLTVNGCYINSNGMTGAAIELNNWTGASIHGNTSVNTSGRDFVNADAASRLITVGRQSVSTPADTVIGGSINAFVSDNFPVPVAALPASSTLNLGSQFLLQGTGTGANRDLPYVCTTVDSATRAFRRMALSPRKQNAQGAASPVTPNLSSIETFDLTLGGATTINAPTGPYDDGDQITFLFRQNATGGHSLTWNAAYKTDLAASGTGNQYASVTFVWSAGRSVWIQTGKLEWKS